MYAQHGTAGGAEHLVLHHRGVWPSHNSPDRPYIRPGSLARGQLARTLALRAACTPDWLWPAPWWRAYLWRRAVCYSR